MQSQSRSEYPLGLQCQLTDFPTPYHSSLFTIERVLAGGGVHKLDETVGLLDRYLGQFAVLVKDMKQISFCDSLRW
jgi:hypothetical protein